MNLGSASLRRGSAYVAGGLARADCNPHHTGAGCTQSFGVFGRTPY